MSSNKDPFEKYTASHPVMQKQAEILIACSQEDTQKNLSMNLGDS